MGDREDNFIFLSLCILCCLQAAILKIPPTVAINTKMMISTKQNVHSQIPYMFYVIHLSNSFSSSNWIALRKSLSDKPIFQKCQNECI